MRPRLITAENLRLVRLAIRPVDLASMRPRLITAENVLAALVGAGRGDASMRPRLITAENRSCGRRPCCAGRCFNEAAAHHRGEQL